MEKDYLVNAMEDLVEQKLDEILSFYDCCKCDQCKMDMKAYALNQVVPKYVVSSKGALYAKLESIGFQHRADILMAVTKAIELVSTNPRHL